MVKIIVPFPLLVALTFTITSCEGSSPNPSQEKSSPKKDYYNKRMKWKNFKLYEVGECEGDAESGTSIIDWIMNSKNGKVVQFKIAAGHIMEFLGDYTIKNDTLIVKLEHVDGGVCMCSCWHTYRLEMNNIKQDFTQVEIYLKEE
jgi:hypothetical protein